MKKWINFQPSAYNYYKISPDSMVPTESLTVLSSEVVEKVCFLSSYHFLSTIICKAEYGAVYTIILFIA